MNISSGENSRNKKKPSWVYSSSPPQEGRNKNGIEGVMSRTGMIKLITTAVLLKTESMEGDQEANQTD